MSTYTDQFHLARHLALLLDYGLVILRPILEAIAERRSEIAHNWYRHYAFRYGTSHTLSEGDFTRIFESALGNESSTLLSGNVREYGEQIARLHRSLVEHHVPLEEAIRMFQLFKDSARIVFPHDPDYQRQIDTIFDDLNNVRMLLLSSAYVRSPTRPSTKHNCRPGRLGASSNCRFYGLLGTSHAMQGLYQRIEAVGKTNGNLLIVGEGGTGKELVAWAVHKCGPRANRPFVALNCAALPNDLIESELFGHEGGALSGATSDRHGMFLAADGGTLFLDEIIGMSVETQGKLLHAIQERAVRPAGSNTEQPVDVRLIASINCKPQVAVGEGRVRADLYYKLQADQVVIPPLRDRREDIPLLADYFIRIFNQSLGRSVAGIEPQAMDALTAYDWPGNVRELSNAIEEACTFGRGDLISVRDLPPAVVAPGRAHASSRVTESLPAQSAAGDAAAIIPTFAETEREVIARALQNNGGTKVHTADELKISRKRLYSIIAKYGLSANSPVADQ